MSNTTKQYIRLFLGIILVYISPYILLGVSIISRNIIFLILVIIICIAHFFTFSMIFLTEDEDLMYMHRLFLLKSCENCYHHKKEARSKQCTNSKVKNKDKIDQSKYHPIFTICDFYESRKMKNSEEKKRRKSEDKENNQKRKEEFSKIKSNFNNEIIENKESDYEIIK